jgi:two-component system sensor histidine kinase KdpD
LKQFLANKTSGKKQYYIVGLLISSVAAVCYLFSGFIEYKVTAFVLLVTVSIIAMLFDILPVLLSALLSALILDFFFIPPRFTFHTGTTEDSIMLLMYFVIASVSAVLTYKVRQMEKIAREEQEKANAVKLYNMLLNSLSHELRTPIATIVGASDNLLNGTKVSEDNKRKLVAEISKASLRLNSQVENLLNMSRLESGFIQPKKDWCDVQELVYSVINQLEDVLKQHELKVFFETNLPLFKLDFGLMQQVLNNLLGNAAFYTPEGSLITINVGVEKNKNYEQPEKIIISVSDNGKGFPEDEISKVFDKFYRLKNSKTGGTGLGLSIAKGFVEAHDGNISLNNAENGGAQFRILVPAETSYLNNQKNE